MPVKTGSIASMKNRERFSTPPPWVDKTESGRFSGKIVVTLIQRRSANPRGRAAVKAVEGDQESPLPPGDQASAAHPISSVRGSASRRTVCNPRRPDFAPTGVATFNGEIPEPDGLRAAMPYRTSVADGNGARLTVDLDYVIINTISLMTSLNFRLHAHGGNESESAA